MMHQRSETCCKWYSILFIYTEYALTIIKSNWPRYVHYKVSENLTTNESQRRNAKQIRRKLDLGV